MPLIKFVIIVLFLLNEVIATEKCVWAAGFIRCEVDQNKQIGARITLYDKDSRWLFELIDKDDKMDITITDTDGKFGLNGCARDIDWIFLHDNHPDPYITIEHKCNEHNETKTLKINMPKTFAPDSHDFGLIILDTHKQITDPETIMYYQNNDEGSGQVKSPNK